MSDLSTQALMMTVNISQWSARKKDQDETVAVSVKHNVRKGQASVYKGLFTNAHSLTKVHNLSQAIRKDFYNSTITWGHNQGIFKSDAYLTVAPRFAEWKTEWYAAVEEFLAEYDVLCMDAKADLNTMHREEDYPEVSQLRAKFNLDISFSLLPSPQDCSKISTLGDFADTLAKDMVEQFTAREKSAMQETWQRLYDMVQRAHERLTSTDGVVRADLIESAREVCSLLPSLNISNDPNLEAMRQSLETSLCYHDAAHLRADPLLREEVADKMSDIMSKMSAFYG